MGTTQSRIGDNRCFCIPPVLNKTKTDLIGSPLPDTPIFQRKIRQNVQEAIMNEATPFTTRYGLENEASFRAPVPPTTELDPNQLQVYEGEDCEQKMQEKYDLREVLGVGSSSTVHRCILRATKESFACKVIDCQHMDEKFRAMMYQFQTEVESLRELRHPGIISLFDVYIKPGSKMFIITELLEGKQKSATRNETSNTCDLGGELFDYVVHKGTLTEDEASDIVRKVTSALVFMHSKHIGKPSSWVCCFCCLFDLHASSQGLET